MGMMVWMMLFWLLLIIGAAALAVALSRRNTAGDSLERLRERLAAGEIDVEEFEHRAEALRRSGPVGGLPMQWLIVGTAFAVGAFIFIPAIVMGAGDWDMWDMHGRGRDTASSPSVQGGLNATVRIENFAFGPGNLQVPIGATVTWTNNDSATHDATASNGDWQTERLSRGDGDALTFDSAGEYNYYCSIHPSMKARLVVR